MTPHILFSAYYGLLLYERLLINIKYMPKPSKKEYLKIFIHRTNSVVRRMSWRACITLIMLSTMMSLLIKLIFKCKFKSHRNPLYNPYFTEFEEELSSIIKGIKTHSQSPLWLPSFPPLSIAPYAHLHLPPLPLTWSTPICHLTTFQKGTSHLLPHPISSLTTFIPTSTCSLPLPVEFTFLYSVFHSYTHIFFLP